MFDFRYHAVSLVAVLVALVVGLLLGVAIGDAGLVSSAEKNIRESLKGEVRAAQNQASDSQRELSAQERYARAAYPLLVSGRLDGLRIGLLFLGQPSQAIRDNVGDALRETKPGLTGTLTLREPPNLGALSSAAGFTRYSTLESDPDLVKEFGRRIGIQLVQGGLLLRREAKALFSTRAGSLGPFDAMIIYRDQPKLKGDDEQTTNDLEDGIIMGLTDNPVAVVGVQTTTTDPSQIPWYRDRDLTTVNNIDQLAGQAALVFALGGATGSFGVGPEAQSLLPGPESVGG